MEDSMDENTPSEVEDLCNALLDGMDVVSAIHSLIQYSTRGKWGKGIHLFFKDPETDPQQSLYIRIRIISAFRIRVAKNLSKSWETHIKIHKNQQNIIFLKIEITLF